MLLATTNMQIVGPVVFSKIETFSVISGPYMTKIFFHDYIEFFNIFASEIIRSTITYINPKTLINITSYTISVAVFQRNDDPVNQLYPYKNESDFHTFPCFRIYIWKVDLSKPTNFPNIYLQCKYM